MRKTLIAGLIAAAGLSGACASSTENATPTPTPFVSPSPTPAERAVTGTLTSENKDGSTTVLTTYSDGSKVEVRSFNAGKVSKVTRETTASGEMTARVTMRADNSEVEIKDKSWIDKSMDATGDAIETAAIKTKEGTLTAYDKSVEGAKTIGEKTAETSKSIADKTVSGAKKVGEKTAEGAEKVGEKTVEGAKAVGAGAKKIGSKIIGKDDKKKNN